MGGVNTKPIEQVADTQSAFARQYKAWGGEDRAISGAALAQPIERVTNLMTGNRSALADVAAPAARQIGQEYKSGVESIYSNVPKGQMQDVALSGAKLYRAGATSGALNSAFTGAFPMALQLGSALGSQSLNEASGAISGTQLASQAEADVMKSQAAKKQATMGFLGDMAKVAATAASGGMR